MPPQDHGLDPLNRLILIRQTITLTIVAGNPAKRLERPALRQQRQLPPQHRRGKSDEKLVPAGQEIEDRGTIRQGIGKAEDIG